MLPYLLSLSILVSVSVCTASMLAIGVHCGKKFQCLTDTAVDQNSMNLQIAWLVIMLPLIPNSNLCVAYAVSLESGVRCIISVSVKSIELCIKSGTVYL